LDNGNNWKKNTALFVSSQTISLFGSMLVQYAITWHITLETQSGIMMTLSIICGFVPTLIVSPFAGVWADRYDRKAVIILSDSLIAASTLALAALFMFGLGSIWLLFVALAVRSFGAGIQTPAVGAFLPQLVPEDKLTRVNGLNSSLQSLIALLSPMLSGALLSLASLEAIFFIDVVTAAVAVAILLILRLPARETAAAEPQKTGYFSDMGAGLRYIIHHRFVRTLFIYCAVYFVLVAPLAFLTSLQVTRSFGDDVWRLTVLEVGFSSGMMLGGLIIASWGGFKNRVHTMLLSLFVVAVCTIFLGLVRVFWIYLAFMGIVGISMSVFNTPFTVLLQQKVEPEYMGRVFGVLSMISSSIMPLAMFIFGPAADIISIESLLVATGMLMLALCATAMRSRVLLEGGRQEHKAKGSQMGDNA